MPIYLVPRKCLCTLVVPRESVCTQTRDVIESRVQREQSLLQQLRAQVWLLLPYAEFKFSTRKIVRSANSRLFRSSSFQLSICKNNKIFPNLDAWRPYYGISFPMDYPLEYQWPLSDTRLLTQSVYDGLGSPFKMVLTEQFSRQKSLFFRSLSLGP